MTDEQPTTNIETLRFRLRERAKAFAQSEIATLSDLHEQEKPPEDLWRAFGVTGMTSIGLAPEYGGDGGDLRAMAQVGGVIAAEGGNLGLAGAWMARQLCARLHIYGYGTDEQKEWYLPRLAAGLLTPCFAVSEPGAGAHPKHLKTEAVRDGDHYIVNGKKAYLTNGPISDLILLMAITGVEEGRKQYSIFLVPRETPGIEETEGVKIDFLKPSCHCGMRFTDVRVPADALLGPEGDAFATFSLPMRKVEDAISAANKAGAYCFQINQLGREVAACDLDKETLAELGSLAAARDGLSALSYRAVELLDLDPVGNAETVEATTAAARDWIKGLQQRVEAFIERTGITPSPKLAAVTRDIVKTTSIAGGAHAIHAERRARELMK